MAGLILLQSLACLFVTPDASLPHLRRLDAGFSPQTPGGGHNGTAACFSSVPDQAELHTPDTPTVFLFSRSWASSWQSYTVTTLTWPMGSSVATADRAMQNIQRHVQQRPLSVLTWPHCLLSHVTWPAAFHIEVKLGSSGR
jgi:hypothetical protein